MCAASLGDFGDGAAWQRGAHDAVVGQGQTPKVSKGDSNQRVRRLWLHSWMGQGEQLGQKWVCSSQAKFARQADAHVGGSKQACSR